MQTILAVRTTGRGTWRETFGGISAFAKSCGWQVQPVDARAGRPDFAALAEFWEAAGWIVDASGGAAALRGADFGGRPAVAINPDEPLGRGIAEIGNDPGEIAKLAMGELLRLGPASIAFAEWFQRRDWVVKRLAAARRIAAMHGVPLRLIRPGPDGGSPGAVGRLAEALRAMPKPAGVFAVADDVGRLVLAAAARLGLDVPGEVAVVSVDDDPEVCENCTPSLTSVRPDYRGLGFGAASALHALLCGDRPPARSQVPLSGLARRASTAAMRRQDRKVSEALEKIRLGACDGLAAGDVAKLFGASLHTAEDRFKAAVGRTIGEEIMLRRFAAACSYLREGRASIDAVADFCGWHGAPAFRKAFKARFGLSPRAWAARNGSRRSARGGEV